MPRKGYRSFEVPMRDPISIASSRLFGVGVDRRQRLTALRFLGVLLVRADADGRIHCDPEDLAGLGILNGLRPDEVERSRIWLEAVGVLEREPTGWFIHDFAPVADEVPPAEAMAAIARVLGRPVEDEPVVVAEPVALVTAAPDASRSRWSTRWMAAPVGVAAAVLVLALVLSGQLQLPVPGRTVSNTRENAQEASSGDRTTAAGGSGPSSATSPSSSATSPASGQSSTKRHRVAGRRRRPPYVRRGASRPPSIASTRTSTARCRPRSRRSAPRFLPSFIRRCRAWCATPRRRQRSWRRFPSR